MGPPISSHSSHHSHSNYRKSAGSPPRCNVLMPFTTKAQLHAVVLAGAISAPPATSVVLELAVPAIHRTVRHRQPPLDLEAPRFRYSVSAAGAAVVVREGARVHASKCGNLRRRSPARP
jgi:hypothetical protein